jgi:hypothetical protein
VQIVNAREKFVGIELPIRNNTVSMRLLWLWPHKNPRCGATASGWYVDAMTSELSAEDALRLAVLLAGDVDAVRISEGTLTLHALTPKGEAKIALSPNCRPETYLTHVREVLGGYALGLPGGYPVHLRRWTRLGRSSPVKLAALLKLGEPEAVAAVAQAPELTDELARRVWWALPTVEAARAMLAHPEVRQGRMGRELADFLVDNLPFEAEPTAAMNTVRVVLAAGQLDQTGQRSLWQKARRRPHYLIGFLESLPDTLPTDEPGRALPEAVAGLEANPWAKLLARCYSPAGQAWLEAAELALDKASAHEAVYLLLDLIGAYFASVRGAAGRPALPIVAAELAALAALAEVSNRDAEEILLRTTAVGALLRKKLEPLIAPLLDHLRLLRGRSGE